MNLKILKQEKDSMQIELEGAGKTFANVLREELYEDKSVKSAAYFLKHPLTSHPQIIIRTSGKSPKTALKDAAKRIERKAVEFETKFKKAK